MSADVGAKGKPRAKAAQNKPRRSRQQIKKPSPLKSPAIESHRSPVVASPRSASPRATPLQAGIAIAVVALIVVALAVSRRSAPAAAVSDGRAEGAADAAQPAPSMASIVPAPVWSVAPAATPAAVTPRVVRETPKMAPVQPIGDRAGRSPKTTDPAKIATQRAETPASDFAATPAAPAPEPPIAAAVTPTDSTPLVTITGCLEVSTDGETFRLADVEGADAPKSRSWRTGFFKKRPAPVTLAEPVDHASLATNVGRRVAATGQLDSRELKVNALRVLASSCN